VKFEEFSDLARIVGAVDAELDEGKKPVFLFCSKRTVEQGCEKIAPNGRSA
jgi:hypothetical protein